MALEVMILMRARSITRAIGPLEGVCPSIGFAYIKSLSPNALKKPGALVIYVHELLFYVFCVLCCVLNFVVYDVSYLPHGRVKLVKAQSCLNLEI
jgi:hypothetical protein